MKLHSKKNKAFLSKDQFLLVVIGVFVFVSSTALALGSPVRILKRVVSSYSPPEQKVFFPVPVLASDYFPVISAQGVIATDLDSGINLYEKNPDQPLLPASTTKIVTALVALDHFQPDQILTVGQNHVVGQKMGLYPGEQLRFQDLLYALLVYSANDAAETIAENYCLPQSIPDTPPVCGRDFFIAAMNEKAKSLSMINSSFQNPVGLDGTYQITTARDLIRVSEVAMKNPEFAKIVGTKQVELTDITQKSKYNLKNINELLGTVDGVLGVKTGWTENARENLVTYIERDGHRVMIALLGSQDRFGETTELINWIFGNYKWEAVVPN